MKIAQIVCRFKPYKAGIGNVAYSNALGLAKLGHQVTVFTPLYNNKDASYASADFKIVRLRPWLKFGNAGFLPQLFWKLKSYDIIHLHYPFFGGAEVVWLLKKIKKNKMPLVITYHHDIVGGKFLKLFFNFHNKYLLPRIIKSADKVIVTTFDYAQNSNISKLIRDYPEKFIEIPLSVDLHKFSPGLKDADLAVKYGLNPGQDKVLLFVGALDKAHYFKGIDFLIKSFNVLDYSGCNEKCGYQIKLLIIGDGELKPVYEKQVLDMGLQNKIIFCGQISDDDLARHYNLADAVILPSIDKSEAFGIVLIEAMACAKPVIAANLAGVRSVFTNNISGCVFEVGQEGDLANCVNKLFSNDSLRNQMGLAARQLCEQKYSQDILSKKLEDAYNSYKITK